MYDFFKIYNDRVLHYLYFVGITVIRWTFTVNLQLMRAIKSLNTLTLDLVYLQINLIYGVF